MIMIRCNSHRIITEALKHTFDVNIDIDYQLRKLHLIISQWFAGRNHIYQLNVIKT